MSRRSKAARRQEFEQACLEYLDLLYAAALRLTGNRVDADELVQDTFLKAFRFAGKFEWGTNLKAWLFRIQTNTFINNYRHRSHERRYAERVATESVYDELMDRQARAYASDPEAHVFSCFFKEELNHALDELPDDFRVAVVLSDMQGFSYKEIAEMLGCPIGTVMSRLHRGRRLLQRELIDYAVEAGIVEDGQDRPNGSSPADLAEFRSRKKGAS